MRANFNLIRAIGLLLIGFFIISCAKEDGKTASYTITIEGGADGTVQLIGEDIDSNWDESLGLIFLSTDDKNEPTGTLTIIISTPFQSMAFIESASLSTVDQLMGTGEEINGQLYNFNSGISSLENIVTGANYISGELINLPMINSSTQEEVMVSGTFTAVSK